MKIIDLNQKEFNGECVVGLGNFDGFHLGHQSLFSNVKQLANEKDISSAILIFKTHTKNIVGVKKKQFLTTFEDKIGIAEKLGLDIAFVLDFNKKFASQTPEEFIEHILYEKMHTRGVVIGDNFHFGHKASGNKNTLFALQEKYNYKTVVTDPVCYQEKLVSSTRIRQALIQGDLETANECLGRPYRIYGKVVHGKHRGRDLGFPTANIELLENYILPAEGVYFTTVWYDGMPHTAMSSIGNNPTFDDKELKIESYLLDFHENLYSKRIKIEFHRYMRPNIKFENSEDLIEQMKQDQKNVENYAKKLV